MESEKTNKDKDDPISSSLRNTTENTKDTVKLLLIGDQAVGKSSLMFRYTDDTFNEFLSGTAGIDLKKKNVKINDIEYKILIYDTAGHERYRQFAKSQIKSVHGILIVYDITDQNSFINVTTWIKSIEEMGASTTSLVLVGNKIDLESKRVIRKKDAETLAESYGITYYETSACSGDGLEECFLHIIQKSIGNLIKRKSMIPQQTTNKPYERTKNKKKSTCICN